MSRNTNTQNRTVVARLLAAAGAIIMLIALCPTSASAMSRYTTWQGSPGQLTVTSVVTGYPSYAGATKPKVVITPAHVRRSPATAGAQTVYYEYRTYQWNGASWQASWKSTGSGTIPAGQTTAVLQGSDFGGTQSLSATGFIKVELVVAFYSGNTYLGHFNIWHDEARDYSCFRGATAYGACQVSPGYLYVS